MGWDYSEKTKQLFIDAIERKPGTHIGEIENADGFGEHGSIACGDALRFTFRVERDPVDPLKDVITEARYLTFGCTSAIAASEALCAMIEGKRLTPIEALKITNQDIVDYLDGLPEQKIHCSVMGAEALEAAVFNWAQKRGVNLNALGIDIHEHEQEEGRVVCKCFSLTEPYIKRKIKELNLHTIPEIIGAIKAGGACMSCHHAPGGLQDLLIEVWGKNDDAAKMASVTSSAKSTKSAAQSIELNVIDATRLISTLELDAKISASDKSAKEKTSENLSPYQLAKKVEKLIDTYIRPMVARDGGDVEIIDIKDQVVYVELAGACAGCASAGQTVKLLIEKTLKDQVDERIRVVQV
ncbi:MAG: iron-sulfur cluster assembly scaffold protein [Planctomycetaceae bacterium]|jgi:NifU-like protein|nr:iron-sulfur cluster assembly scaffold protein [Planctomycetaceae bacterium]